MTNEFNLKQELYRKIFHIFILIIPITYYQIGKWQSLAIFAPLTIILVTIDYLRQNNEKINLIFNKLFRLILRDKEKNGKNFCGGSFVGMATCFCFLFFKIEYVVAGFFILGISDSLAALIGKSIKSRAFFEKSLAGSLAFFISSFVILIGCGIFFDTKISFYIFGLFAISCVTMFEARPSLVEIDDNFAIPAGFCLIASLLDLIWNFN